MSCYTEVSALLKGDSASCLLVFNRFQFGVPILVIIMPLRDAPLSHHWLTNDLPYITHFACEFVAVVPVAFRSDTTIVLTNGYMDLLGTLQHVESTIYW